MIRCRLLPWLTLACAVGAAHAQEIPWRQDYGNARQEAATSGRPLLLHFTTENCPWCVRLERTTYRDPAVFKALSEQLIPVKINYSQYQQLCDDLRIQSFPTIVIAGPKGNIVAYHKGYLEAAPFMQLLGQAVTRLGPVKPPDAVAARPEEKTKPVEAAPASQKDKPAETPATPVARSVTPPAPPPPTDPAWMLDDFRTASDAVAHADVPRAMHLLRGILKDSTNLPVQERAQVLLRQIEKEASERLNQVKEAQAKGQYGEAFQLAQELVRRYDGTDAAAQGLMQLSQLNSRIDDRERDRMKQARALLALAKEDFRAGQWLPCLLRCEEVLARYSDLSQENNEANDMASQIKANPERLQKICDNVPEVLGLVYLTTAEAKIKQGEPQQAVFFLERILQAFPNSRHAEMAQVRLAQIQGPPSVSADDRKP